MKKIILIGLLTFGIIACNQKKSPEEVTNYTPVELKKGDKVEFIKFSAVWCGPCQRLKPKVDKLKPNYPNITFTDIDTDKQPEMSKKYQVTGLPTIVIELNGKQSNRLVGAPSDKELKALLDRYKFPVE